MTTRFHFEGGRFEHSHSHRARRRFRAGTFLARSLAKGAKHAHAFDRRLAPLPCDLLGQQMTARPRVHGFNPALFKVSDEALRAGEVSYWAEIARSCESHLADLVREHGRLMRPACQSRAALEPEISCRKS